MMDALQTGLFAPLILTPDRKGAVFSAEQIIEDAFVWHRTQGFPYPSLPRFVMMQQINRLAAMDDDALIATSEAYRVADTFHPHRFRVTVDGKISPLQCFTDDVKFKRALALALDCDGRIPENYFSEIGLSSGTQACANFRPGFACVIYRRFCRDGATVLDPCTGYGGRLVGFVAARVGGRYIGCDPHTLTHAGNQRLAEFLGVADAVQLYNVPIEDLDVALVRDRCDFVFTSPPYFTKEHYSEEVTQSWRRYGASFDTWLDGFLRPMLALGYASLREGCFAVVNIADVTIRGRTYPLVRSTIGLAEGVGFRHVATEVLRLTTRFGAHQAPGVAAESVLIFQKSGLTVGVVSDAVVEALEPVIPEEVVVAETVIDAEGADADAAQLEVGFAAPSPVRRRNAQLSLWESW